MNPQSLEQANALLAAAAETTAVGDAIARPLAELGREVGLPSPLALARAVRALVSRGRLAADDGTYRLVDARPLEAGERVSVAPRPGRRGRTRRAPQAEPDGAPTYSDLGRALVERLIEMARETAAVAELADLRRQLREERSARVRAEERSTDLHARVRDLESKLQMAEENLRQVLGVVRQQPAGSKAPRPSDPETEALLAILRGNGDAAAGEGAGSAPEQTETPA